MKLFLIFAVIFAAGCRNKTSVSYQPDVVNEYQLISSADGANKHTIKFIDTITYNFGEIKKGDTVKHRFRFKNVGKLPLIIKNVYSSCGCTVAGFPRKPILPNMIDSVTAVFSSNNSNVGMENKVITVYSNDVSSPHMLTILGHVK
jgi:hypothetical protein